MTMKKTPVYFIGGMLGAGKTTALKTLSSSLAAAGLKAGLITNDQSDGLVDTLYISTEALDVQEVTGSCFCCDFNGLADSILNLLDKQPDVILAEPVGSCTDVVATVLKPLSELMRDTVEVKAFSVLLDPGRYYQLQNSENDEPQDEKWSVKYLLEKQLEEADFILINKTDLYSKDSIDKLGRDLEEKYNCNIIYISALKGWGVNEWFDDVSVTAPSFKFLHDIDYDLYARAEAEMGWLNTTLEVHVNEKTDFSAITSGILKNIADALNTGDHLIGNMKIMASLDKEIEYENNYDMVSEKNWFKTGIADHGAEPDISDNDKLSGNRARLTVNIRAVCSPEKLTEITEQAVKKTLAAHIEKADILYEYMNSFRPAAPSPTHRMVS